MAEKSAYKKHLPYQSEYSHKYCSWASNHNGWARMKKRHRRLAKRRLQRLHKQEVNNG